MIPLALVFFGLAALGGILLSNLAAPEGLAGIQWAGRVALVVALPPLAFAIWQAAQPPTGWPAHVKPPKNAGFLWAYVREPDPLAHSPGEIDLWLLAADQPRAYRLPYTRRLHEQAVAAMRGTKRGVKVGVRIVPGGQHGPRVRYQFYRLPPPQPSVKN